jgi:hypothetical protein
MKSLQFTGVLVGVVLLMGDLAGSGSGGAGSPPEALSAEFARVVFPQPADQSPSADRLAQFFSSVLPPEWQNSAVVSGRSEPRPERIPTQYAPTEQWLAELRCLIFMNSIMYGRIHDSIGMPFPQDESLLTNPFRLWLIPGLRLRPAIVTPLRAPSGQVDRKIKRKLESELSDALQPGEIVIIKDPGYGVIWGSPLLLGCKNPNKPLELAVADYRPNPPWIRHEAEILVADYWGTIEVQLYNAIRYYYLATGEEPRRREDLQRVLGPENPKAWNPWVQIYVESILSRIRVERYVLVHGVRKE